VFPRAHVKPIVESDFHIYDQHKYTGVSYRKK